MIPQSATPDSSPIRTGTYPEISLRKTRNKRDEIRRDLCNGIDQAANQLETNDFPYVGRISAARIAGADPLAVSAPDRVTGHLRAYSSRALDLQPRIEAAEGECRDIAADLITLLVPVEAEPMATVIA